MGVVLQFCGGIKSTLPLLHTKCFDNIIACTRVCVLTRVRAKGGMTAIFLRNVQTFACSITMQRSHFQGTLKLKDKSEITSL